MRVRRTANCIVPAGMDGSPVTGAGAPGGDPAPGPLARRPGSGQPARQARRLGRFGGRAGRGAAAGGAAVWDRVTSGYPTRLAPARILLCLNPYLPYSANLITSHAANLIH